MICETLNCLKGTKNEKVMGFGGKRGVLREEKHICNLEKLVFLHVLSWLLLCLCNTKMFCRPLV
jgi:hypothetical protein